MNLSEIRSRLAAVREGLRFLAGLESLDDTQAREFDWLDAEETYLAGVEQELARRESRRTEVRDRVANGDLRTVPGDGTLDRDPLGDPADSDPSRGRRNPWDLSTLQTFGRSRDQVTADLRARAAEAIERMPAMNDARKAALTDIIERFEDEAGNISHHVLVSSDPAYLRAFSKAVRGQLFALTDDEKGAMQRAQELARAMSLTDNAGGFLVPQQLDPALILTSDGTTNPIREVARKVVATGDTWQGVSTTHATWSWDGEAAEVSDDATTFAQPSVPVHKAQGFIPISIEALADERNVTEAIGLVLARGRDDLEAAAFVTGSGTNQPTGIVTALTGTSSVVTSATTDTFAIADVYAVEEALPARYRKRAQWMADKPIYNDIRQFGTSDSHALWERLGAGQPPLLLGYPAHEASEFDGAINATLDNFVLALGDWENYVIADRLGMVVELIPHLMGANRRPTGQRGFYAYYRVGADSVNDGGFRLLNVT